MSQVASFCWAGCFDPSIHSYVLNVLLYTMINLSRTLNGSYMSIVIQLKIIITVLNYTAIQKGFKYPSLTLINALPDYV